jgi:hypothetical protein
MHFPGTAAAGHAFGQIDRGQAPYYDLPAKRKRQVFLPLWARNPEFPRIELLCF